MNNKNIVIDYNLLRNIYFVLYNIIPIEICIIISNFI